MGSAQSFAALLRGINVGGKNRLPMRDLEALLASLGHEDVASYIQSGNVVFRSADADAGRVAEAIESGISARFELDVRVLLRTHVELEGIVSKCPFGEAVHVVFLDGAPTADKVSALERSRSPGDAFEVSGREIYLSLRNGAGRTKLTLEWFERRLGAVGTQRNWNTVLRLVALTAERAGG
jgi:uncharacterized protein (DUF1697 family)